MQENASYKTVRYQLSWLLFAGNETICKMLEARIGLADEKKEIEREKGRRTLCVLGRPATDGLPCFHQKSYKPGNVVATAA